jgi:hypothetical protein
VNHFFVVLEYDRLANGDLGLLGKQILKKRFEAYNMAWLQEVGCFQHGGGATSPTSGMLNNPGNPIMNVNDSLNMSNMSMNMGIMGNLYGPHGAISHMLDDGDSMVSMGPGTGLHGITDKVGPLMYQGLPFYPVLCLSENVSVNVIFVASVVSFRRLSLCCDL